MIDPPTRIKKMNHETSKIASLVFNTLLVQQ
jgi:hypothetical protein